jgi:lipoprotein-releasing system permease protein
MRFELFVALRYLRAKRRRAFIGVITGISVAGVASGVASLVIALAINSGFRRDLQDRLLSSTAHVDLLRIKDDGIVDWRPLMDRLSKQPHVVATAPAIYGEVLIYYGPRAQGAVIKGLIPKYDRRVSDMLKSIKSGSAEALDESPNHVAVQPSLIDSPDNPQGVKERVAAMTPILLGKDMADKLGVQVGMVVTVVSPQGELTPYGMAPNVKRFPVVGIFNSGFYDYDAGWAVTSLSAAQQLFGLGDIATEIEFKVDDIYNAPRVGDELKQAAGNGFMTTNWMEQNKALFHALNMEKAVTFLTIGLIVFVAALNILISLIMMVMAKTRDIAVLMSMGTRKSQIRRIFIAQGLLIGVVGTVFGLILGYSLSWAGGHYHLLSLAPEIYSINYVPFAPHLKDGFWVALVAVGISFLATIYPSWSAARILPAETLRYE